MSWRKVLSSMPKTDVFRSNFKRTILLLHPIRHCGDDSNVSGLWLCFTASHTDAAKKALDPLQLMKLPRTNNLCSELQNPVMNDQARSLIVDIHNRRRAVLVQGQVRNGKNNYNMPKGSNMMTMDYDCNLEADAQMYANLCRSSASPDDQRPLWGENFYQIQEGMDPILAAGDAWWGEIYKNGINQKMLFNKFFAEKEMSPTSFTQVGAVHSTKKCLSLD
ncbi:hypothetical protein Y032_0002g604 [Ancylostoma ceylanicum]|uniref:SCP domain-containing protein n=1 Tax=Ancylostoma ceylanicum TaxID=53326 RepID=A0A016W0E7_9BILA|nr:hypothetical protein Y032_0002g604 [Ancylostoma ceylanicum]